MQQMVGMDARTSELNLTDAASKRLTPCNSVLSIGTVTWHPWQKGGGPRQDTGPIQRCWSEQLSDPAKPQCPPTRMVQREPNCRRAQAVLMLPQDRRHTARQSRCSGNRKSGTSFHCPYFHKSTVIKFRIFLTNPAVALSWAQTSSGASDSCQKPGIGWRCAPTADLGDGCSSSPA